MSLTITVRDPKLNLSKSFTAKISEEATLILVELREYLRKVYGTEI